MSNNNKRVLLPKSAATAKKTWRIESFEEDGEKGYEKGNVEVGKFKEMKGIARWGILEAFYKYRNGDRRVKSQCKILLPEMNAPYGLSKGKADDKDKDKDKKDSKDNKKSAKKPTKKSNKKGSDDESEEEEAEEEKKKPEKLYIKADLERSDPQHVLFMQMLREMYDDYYKSIFANKEDFSDIVTLKSSKGSELFKDPFDEKLIGEEPDLSKTPTISLKDEPWGRDKTKYLLPDGKTPLEKEEFMNHGIRFRASVNIKFSVALGAIYWKHSIDEIMLLDMWEIDRDPTLDKVAEENNYESKYGESLRQKIEEERALRQSKPPVSGSASEQQIVASTEKEAPRAILNIDELKAIASGAKKEAEQKTEEAVNLFDQQPSSKTKKSGSSRQTTKEIINIKKTPIIKEDD
jgi:hypothetical protein